MEALLLILVISLVPHFMAEGMCTVTEKVNEEITVTDYVPQEQCDLLKGEKNADN